MNSLIRVTFSLLGLGIFVSCQKHDNHDIEIKKIEIQELPNDFFLPSRIWRLVTSPGEKTAETGHGNAADSHAAAGKDAKVPEVGTKTQPVIFSPAQIMLIEKNPGVLKWPQIIVQFPLGGGQLDLKDYLTGVVGTFYVRFISTSAENEKEVIDPEIFYWSRARKRRIENEVFGSGCNKIVQLSMKKILAEDKQGIKVNTKDHRYLSVLAGHYFFVKRSPKETQVSQIEITNSQIHQHLCEVVQTHKSSDEKGAKDDPSSIHE